MEAVMRMSVVTCVAAMILGPVACSESAGGGDDQESELKFALTDLVNGRADDGATADGERVADVAKAPCEKHEDCEKLIPGIDQCEVVVCSPALKICTVLKAESGFPCEDGDSCTSGDICADGNCVGGKDVCNFECGDSICEGNENCLTCPEDCDPCPPGCGDGDCGAGENCTVCPPDCGACALDCGNGECIGEETCADCPVDCGECPPKCGDGDCNGDEDCLDCFEDCGECPPKCGDGECNGDETCADCHGDCGECTSECNDGKCELDETCQSCPYDCGFCEGTEDCCSKHVSLGCEDDAITECVCSIDVVCCISGWDSICVSHVDVLGCGECAVCGDGKCTGNETCFGCPEECKVCGAGDCCVEHGPPGCGDQDVMACVCAKLPFCCQDNWDDECTAGVETHGCGVCQ